MKKMFLILVVALVLAPNYSFANPSGKICLDYRGVMVTWVASSSAAKVADATYTFNGNPVIVYNPSSLGEKSANTRLFFQYRECGRHVLGMTIANSTQTSDWNKVDCWAANTMRYENGLKDVDFKALDEDVAGLSAEEWILAPGPILSVQTISCFK
jgi:hypothetical protein